MLHKRNGLIINISLAVSTIKAAVDRCTYATSAGGVGAVTASTALDGQRLASVVMLSALIGRLAKHGELRQ